MLNDDPIHVLIETVLLATLLYLFFCRKKEDWRNRMQEKLSEEEIEDLLRDWKDKGRHRLSNGSSSDIHHYEEAVDSNIIASRKNGKMYNLIIEKLEGSKMTIRVTTSGPAATHTAKETRLTYIKNKISSKKSSKNDNDNDETTKTITVINFVTHDYLGMSCPAPINDKNTDESTTKSTRITVDPIKESSRKALSRYGCGSCGPRGFYGTIDAHLNLESSMASFTNTEEAVLYSDGATTASSTIAAFAKRGDLLVVDEGVYEALGTGVTLSRANVKYFRHNDMNDLRRVLERVQATDKSLQRKTNDQRRFIVVEGLYKNYGTICPLKDLVKLKEEFSYRLILDESFSFGVIGKTGRGVLEHFDLKHMVDAEIVTISMENAMGSIGGVTVGNEEVVDHQRLSGAGYCFSASMPPFLADAARASLNKMENDPGLVTELAEKVRYFYQEVEEQMGSNTNNGGDIDNKDKDGTHVVPDKVMVTSMKGLSPIVFFQLTKKEDRLLTRDQQVELLERVAEQCLENGVFLVSTGRHVYYHMHKIPPPSLRLTIMRQQSKEELSLAVAVLKKAINDNVV